MQRPSILPLLALLIAAGPALATAPDEVSAEADRLTAEAAKRGRVAGGAVDLVRLWELGDWLPAGDAEARLRAAAEDRERAPLVRAVAWWLLREEALRRLDAEAAAGAARALGLITAFAMRAGPAPHPVAELTAEGWRPYPGDAGAGLLWLEAFLRPERETQATLVTRLVAARPTPAVLRLGYDDAVTVWLNGDELYRSPAEHRAWLDQAAVPIALRAGDNRLVIEVRQRSGAWRLVARVTDPEGRPLPVEAHPDPWGRAPPPADVPPPASHEHLWATLVAAADAEPPSAVDLRDLADYARITGLPDEDQALPRVAIEGAWVSDPGPRTLFAWQQVLPPDERAAVRAAHVPAATDDPAERHARLALALSEGWEHYYARRHRETRTVVESLLAEAPGFLPARRLEAVLYEDLNLPHTAAGRLADADRRWPDRAELRRARVSTFRAAGRVKEALETLEALVADGQAGADDHFQLATLSAARGEAEAAVALLDAVHRARPELWQYALEAAEILAAAGERAEATRRLEALAALIPGDAGVGARLARHFAEAGEPERALPVVEAALAVAPGDEELRQLRARLSAAPEAWAPGPSLAELAKASSPDGVPAHVLYHHARAEVAPDGLALRRVRRVVRVLTEEGARRYAVWELPYVPGRQRLELSAARLLRAGEPPATPARTDRDLSEPEYRLYYDLRAEVLTFARPRPGDLIEVTWSLRDTDPDPSFPGYYGELAYLQEDIPRARSIVEVAGPDHLAVAVVAPSLEVRREGGRVEAADVPGVPREPGRPGASSLRGYVHVSTAGGWDEVTARYLRLLDGRDRPTAALAEKARVWAAGAEEPEEVIRRLYAQVADRTRYVGLEFGVHSFKPELPAVTLARGYGDCKDKATLLIALARARGIDAHLTLVRTRASGAVAIEPASFAVFDHAIVYLPALDRFVDPTVDRNDPWTLPPSDQEALAFVVGVDEHPRRIPSQPAAHNRSEWAVEAVVGAGGSAQGTARWTTRGHPATVARRALEGQGARREVVEAALVTRFPGARVSEPAVSGLTPAFDPVAVEAEVTLPPFTGQKGGFDVPLGGAPWRLVARYAEQATRLTPLQVEFRHVHALRLDLALPSGHGARAPAAVQLDSPFGRFSARVEVASGRLRTEVALTVDVVEVSPAEYPAFRAWLAAVDRALATPVEVRRE